MKKTSLLVLCLFLIPKMVFAEALMFSAENTYHQFPLLRLSTNVSISSEIATITIDQVFQNDTGSEVSGYYYYPLPDNATVTGFGDYFTGGLIYYELVYTDPDSGGGNTVITPYNSTLKLYLGDNPFSITVPDCPTGEFTIRIEYTMLMEYDFGQYIIDYPLDMGSYLNRAIDRFDLDVSIQSDKTITDFELHHDAGTVDYVASDSVHASMTALELIPDEDILLELFVEQSDINMRVWSQTRENEELGYFYAVLEPGEIPESLVNQKLMIFLFDASDSMVEADFLDQAKAATNYCLSQLDPDDYFNVITFGGGVEVWRSAPARATATYVENAKAFVNSLGTTNGTDLNGALMEALSQVWSDAMANQIMVLTDGDPWAPPGSGVIDDLPSIMNNLREYNSHNAAIFTVGFGQAQQYVSGTVAQLDFLRLISIENNGLHMYIKPSVTNVAGEIGNFYLKFSSPVINHLSFTAPSITVDSLFPPPTYGLFAGSQTSIAGRYSAGTTMIELDGDISGRDTSLTFGPFEFPEEISENDFVPRIWAMRGIDYYIAYMYVYGEDEEIINWIVDMSVKFGILTPYTSYTQYTAISDLYASATRTASGVKITWSAPEGQNVDCYNVYRREAGGSSWLLLNSAPLTETSFLDNSALDGWSYEYMLEVVYLNGERAKEILYVDGIGLPEDFKVSTYPNPFNEQSIVTVTLPEEQEISITVYNTLGQQVEQIQQGRLRSGKHTFTIRPKELAGGIYFLEVSSGKRVLSAQRILYLK